MKKVHYAVRNKPDIIFNGEVIAEFTNEFEVEHGKLNTIEHTLYKTEKGKLVLIIEEMTRQGPDHQVYVFTNMDELITHFGFDPCARYMYERLNIPFEQHVDDLIFYDNEKPEFYGYKFSEPVSYDSY